MAAALSAVVGMLMKAATPALVTAANRQEVVVRLRKQAKLQPHVLPPDLESLYVWALVEWGVGRAPELVAPFRVSYVRQAAFGAVETGDWGLVEIEYRQAMELTLSQAEFEQFASSCPTVIEQFRETFDDCISRSRTAVQTRIERELHGISSAVEGLHSVVRTLGGAAEESGGAEPVEESLSRTAFVNEVRSWVEAVRYSIVHETVRNDTSFLFVLEVPAGRRRTDRVVLVGTTSALESGHVAEAASARNSHAAMEAWALSPRRISPAARARAAADDVRLMTFDDLIDLEVDMEPYFTWLDDEVQRRGIDISFVQLSCAKDEVDPDTSEPIARSVWDWNLDGGLTQYARTWLEDGYGEQLSILGEFGTGKSWFALRFAWETARQWRLAQHAGAPRPRIPLYISLRDYTKRSTVEAMLSQFFFVDHGVMPGWSAFQELNRSGRLLLIFDGFDEMAARVDADTMTKQFAELCRTVHPRSKVILTSRTEYFPSAAHARELLEASFARSDNLGNINTSSASPRFDIVEIEPMAEAQISKMLELQPGIRSDLIERPEVRDLLSRPVMLDYLIEALPAVLTDGYVDQAHILMYALRRKMDRDIQENRTFTSRADKMLFLTELATEMVRTGSVKLNYRDFPARISSYFGHRFNGRADVDHWQYDMQTQSMLIRDGEGNYTPSHKSLAEFLVAVRIAGELGAMPKSFMSLFGNGSTADATTWSEFFMTSVEASDSCPNSFTSETLEHLGAGLGQLDFDWTVFRFVVQILEASEPISDPLHAAIRKTVGADPTVAGKLGGHSLSLARIRSFEREDFPSLGFTDLRGAILNGANPNHDMQSLERLADFDLRGADLRGVDLQWADARGADLTGTKLDTGAPLLLSGTRCVDAAIVADGDLAISLVPHGLKLLGYSSGQVISERQVEEPTGNYDLFSAADGFAVLSGKRVASLLDARLEQVSVWHELPSRPRSSYRSAGSTAFELLSYWRVDGEPKVVVTRADAALRSASFLTVSDPGLESVHFVGSQPIGFRNSEASDGLLSIAYLDNGELVWKEWDIGPEWRSAITSPSCVDCKFVHTSPQELFDKDTFPIVRPNSAVVLLLEYADRVVARSPREVIWEFSIESPIQATDVSPSGRRLVFVTQFGRVVVVDTASGASELDMVVNDSLAGARLSADCGLDEAMLRIAANAGAAVS